MSRLYRLFIVPVEHLIHIRSIISLRRKVTAAALAAVVAATALVIPRVMGGTMAGPSGPDDAYTAPQVSVIKFTDTDTNYLAGIALDAGGKVWMWGYNSYGIQGIPNMPMNMASAAAPLPANQTQLTVSGYNGGLVRIPYFVDNNINVVSVTSGYTTNYAIDANGVMYSWGYGVYGNRGDGTITPNSPAAQPIVKITNYIAADKTTHTFAADGVKIAQIYASTLPDGFCYAVSTDHRIFAWA